MGTSVAVRTSLDIAKIILTLQCSIAFRCAALVPAILEYEYPVTPNIVLLNQIEARLLINLKYFIESAITE